MWKEVMGRRMTPREMRGQLHSMLKEHGMQPGTKMDLEDGDGDGDMDDEDEGYETLE